MNNRIIRKIEGISGDYAIFINRKDEPYRVLLSDKVKSMGVKKYDKVEIKILDNGIWVVTDIIEPYTSIVEEPTEEEWEEFNILIGGY